MPPDQTNNLSAFRVQKHTPRRRPAGFTLMELVIVVAICAFLLSMLVVGFKYVAQSGNAKSTIATLESLKAMQANFEKATAGSTSMTIPTAAMLGADSATTPTLVTVDSSTRYGPAIIYTQAIIYRLRSIPDNLAIIQNTPSNRLYIPPLPTSLSTWPALNAVSGQQYYYPSNFATWAWTTGKPYYAGDLAADSASPANIYVCVQDNTAAAGNAPVPGGNAYWQMVSYVVGGTTPASQQHNVPVFLDAWNNPIIFVPAGGLLTNSGLTASPTWAANISYPVNAQVYATVNSVVQSFVCVQAHTSAAGNGPPYSAYWKAAYAPTAYRPFWVSAGPDGRFTDYNNATPAAAPATNDNINSFDN